MLRFLYSSTEYSFSYDAFGNNTEIEVGNTSLATYEYADNNGKLQKVTYGNGTSVEYIYDGVENLSEVWYTVDGARTLAYEYVGRTKNIEARKKAHQNNPFRKDLAFDVIKDNLTYEEARGLEQYYIEEYHTLNAYNKMNNQINGISPLNKKFQIYMNAAMNKLANRLENVILNLTVG